MSYPPGGHGGYPNPGGGYQQPGYQQPGYGGGGFGGQVEHPQGTMVLILGIIGIVACQACAPFAWVIGNRAMAEIDRDPLRYSNRSNVNLGRILGIVGSAILGVYVVFGLLYVVFFLAIFSGSA